MKLPKKGDTVTIEHYGTGKVTWLEGKSFKVKLDKLVDNSNGFIGSTKQISCYLSDLISIDQTTPEWDEDRPEVRVGSKVKHNNFGIGKVLFIRDSTFYEGKNADIEFDYPYNRKTLYLPYAKLEIIEY